MAEVYCSPDQLSMVAAEVSREYGTTGYRIGIRAALSYAVFDVRHSDGSEFSFIVDPYCNIRRMNDGESVGDARARIDVEVSAALDAFYAARGIR